MRRLRWKVSALLLGLILATVFITSWSIERVTDRQFQSYLRHGYEQRVSLLSSNLARIYRATGSWERFLSLPSAHAWLRTVGIIRLADASGRIHYQMDPNSLRMPGPRHPLIINPHSIVTFTIKDGDKILGTAWIFGPPTRGNLPPLERLFQSSLRRAIFLVSLFAGLIALLIGLLGAEHLARPIQELTGIAKRLAAGDLKARSSVNSSDELGQLAATLNHLAGELEHGEELRRNTLADTAHELRTPLTTIQSHLEAMQDGVVPPTGENIRIILEEVQRLTHLTETIQSLSLIERFREHLHTVPIDLTFLLRQADERYGLLFRRQGIRLKAQLPEKPVTVNSHSQAIQQILDNLLMNAAKYTPAHEDREVSLSLSVEAEKAIIRIKDEGIGIPADDLPHIFERFYRVDISRSRLTGGSGLGLSIAWETANAIGGQLTVDSHPGEGTSFTLSLPLAG